MIAMRWIPIQRSMGDNVHIQWHDKPNKWESTDNDFFIKQQFIYVIRHTWYVMNGHQGSIVPHMLFTQNLRMYPCVLRTVAMVLEYKITRVLIHVWHMSYSTSTSYPMWTVNYALRKMHMYFQVDGFSHTQHTRTVAGTSILVLSMHTVTIHDVIKSVKILFQIFPEPHRKVELMKQYA